MSYSSISIRHYLKDVCACTRGVCMCTRVCTRMCVRACAVCAGAHTLLCSEARRGTRARVADVGDAELCGHPNSHPHDNTTNPQSLNHLSRPIQGIKEKFVCVSIYLICPILCPSIPAPFLTVHSPFHLSIIHSMHIFSVHLTFHPSITLAVFEPNMMVIPNKTHGLCPSSWRPQRAVMA